MTHTVGTSPQKDYRAALIVIGNEILSGRTQDKNVNWLALKLLERGISLAEVRVIPDIEDRIIRTVRDIQFEVDYVFTTGGIGPTHDDITAESIAKAFDTELELNADAKLMLENHYGPDNLTPARMKMAMIPKGAELIPNPVSGAPGFIIQGVYVMAGVPKIMQAMLDHVLPGLKGGSLILSRTVSCHLSESKIAEALADVQKKWPNVEIGSYPQFKEGSFAVNIVLRCVDAVMLEAATQDVIAITSL